MAMIGMKMSLEYEDKVCLTCRQWFRALAQPPSEWLECGDCIRERGREERDMVHQVMMWR